MSDPFDVALHRVTGTTAPWTDDHEEVTLTVREARSFWRASRRAALEEAELAIEQDVEARSLEEGRIKILCLSRVVDIPREEPK